MKSILLVDDEMDWLNIMSSIFEKQHFKVHKATGVQSALKALKNNTVDIICSDFNMRDGTGLELLENLQQENVTTPFMLMSAIDDTRLEYEAQRLNASFCCKTDYELVSKIKTMLCETL
jgi:DNA-binding NtrC family response regulator